MPKEIDFMEAMEAVGLQVIVIDETTEFPNATSSGARNGSQATSDSSEATEASEYGLDPDGQQPAPNTGEPTHPSETEQGSTSEAVGYDEEGGLDTESVASPFIEGTNIQYAWDATSLELFKLCPRKYQYSILEGWRSKEESVHLRFGSELHQALHNYDKSRAAGIDHEDALYDVVRDLIITTADWKPDNKYKNIPNLLRSVVWYLDHYNPDPAETVIMGGGEPACEINFKFELPYGPPTTEQPYVLCGYLDRVVEFQGETFIMDRKTTKSTPSAYYFHQFEPNNQMTLYTIVGQIIFGTTIKGVIIDAIQVAIEFSRPVRGLTYRTKDQLDEWMNDLHVWLKKAEDYAIEGYWPQNDTACDKYGGCQFREVCSKSPHVREVYLKSNFKQAPKAERWNPLKPRV